MGAVFVQGGQLLVAGTGGDAAHGQGGADQGAGFQGVHGLELVQGEVLAGGGDVDELAADHAL